MPSLKLRARSSTPWNLCRQKTGIPSASCSRTGPISALTLNHASPFSLSCQTGKPKITNRSSAGQRFTASNFSYIKTEPAERRVFRASDRIFRNLEEDFHALFKSPLRPFSFVIFIFFWHKTSAKIARLCTFC